MAFSATQGAGDDGERRAQFVRGVGGELTLDDETLLEAVQRTEFTAATKGAISLGRWSCGRRTAVAPGPIEAAICETCRSGRSVRADRQDGNRQDEQHEKRDDPGDVENEFRQDGMREGVGARRTRDPDRQRPDGAVGADAEAIVVAPVAAETANMEIVEIVGGRRPVLNESCQCGRGGGDDAPVRAAHSVRVEVQRGFIGLANVRGQVRDAPCRPLRP